MKCTLICRWILLILVPLTISCVKDEVRYINEEDLLEALNALEDVEAIEITPRNNFSRQFAIDLTLPVDHEDPKGSKFVQRMYLSHTGVKEAMVLNLSGYSGSAKSVSELCGILGANQLTIPHRGYYEAEIEPMNWEALTIEQAAEDNHRIVELMKTIYPGEWISTGVSKGGMTALFLEYHHPEDADVVVAYVAPMISGYPDERITGFVKTEGGTEVQADIRTFQRKLLENRDSTLYYFAEYARVRKLDYTLVDLETALELGVMEYAVYIWQYYGGSPYYFESDHLSIEAMVERWAKVASPNLYADQSSFFGKLFYYQAFTEFGYYDLNTVPVADLLQHTGKDGLMLFLPEGVNLEPEFEKMDDITAWLEKSGEQIIYIYGGLDPYTAAAVNPSTDLDALQIIQPGGTHSTKIESCDERSLIFEKLDAWLETEVVRF